MIDTHTHLYAEQFDEDRAEVIARARDAGVTHFLLPAIDSTYTQAMLQMKEHSPHDIHLMAGLHPTHVHPDTLEAELAHVQANLEKGGYLAVGEIGIDLYWETQHKQAQKEAFALQIDWAKAHGLPIVIHARNAFDEIFDVLEDKKGDDLYGILHCFTGNLEQAQQAISYGMKLGIGGVVTFKNGKIDQFLSQIDLSHLVLETDAPYLAPTPYRGKRNESAYLIRVVEKLAEIYGQTTDEIIRQTSQNTRQVFPVLSFGH